MRTYCVVILFIVLCLPLKAQIGINTESPSGLFHVAADDNVVIDNNGNVGIGTTLPAAKLDVRGSVQIIDGLESSGRLLTSDPSGNVRWAEVMSSGGSVEAVLELAPQTFQSNTYTTIPASEYRVASEGYHVFEIRWYAKYGNTSQHIHTATHFRLLRTVPGTQTHTTADEYEMYRNITSDQDDAVTIWTTLSTYANAGDTLRLVVRPSVSHSAVNIVNNDKLHTSKIIVKRLNLR
jgi:hypothetical protein